MVIHQLKFFQTSSFSKSIFYLLLSYLFYNTILLMFSYPKIHLIQPRKKIQYCASFYLHVSITQPFFKNHLLPQTKQNVPSGKGIPVNFVYFTPFPVLFLPSQNFLGLFKSRKWRLFSRNNKQFLDRNLEDPPTAMKTSHHNTVFV